MAELVCDVAPDATQKWMDEVEASKNNMLAARKQEHTAEALSYLYHPLALYRHFAVYRDQVELTGKRACECDRA